MVMISLKQLENSPLMENYGDLMLQATAGSLAHNNILHV